MKLKSTLACITAIACIMKITPLAAQANKQDSLALVDLYNSTNGASWYHNNNWLTAAPLSDWFGVVVAPENGKVTKLDLHFNNLNGNLSASIGNLTALKIINLGSNDLTGPIPKSIGKLTTLQQLRLYQNALTSGIPASIGNLTKLRQLDLFRNQLSDTLPSSMGKLSKLVTLDLSDNYITGNIPGSFGKLDSLQTLNVNKNFLSGKIPESLGNLLNLQYLGIVYNQLSGNIPSSLSKLSKLPGLYFDNNQLSGRIPSSFADLPQTQTITINKNNFTFANIEELANRSNFFYAPQANIPVIQSGDTLSVRAGGTLSNNTYMWYKDGVLVKKKNGGNNFIGYVATSPGKYNVVVTNSIATQLTLYSDTVTISNITAVDNQETEDASEAQTTLTISISPNPVKSNAIIAFNATGKYLVQVTSLSGKIMQAREGVAASGRNTFLLDVSRYVPGTYIVLLTDEKKQSRSVKFNKE